MKILILLISMFFYFNTPSFAVERANHFQNSYLQETSVSCETLRNIPQPPIKPKKNKRLSKVAVILLIILNIAFIAVLIALRNSRQ